MALFVQIKQLTEEARANLVQMEENRMADRQTIENKRAALKKIEAELQTIRLFDISTPGS